LMIESIADPPFHLFNTCEINDAATHFTCVQALGHNRKRE